MVNSLSTAVNLTEINFRRMRHPIQKTGNHKALYSYQRSQCYGQRRIRRTNPGRGLACSWPIVAEKRERQSRRSDRWSSKEVVASEQRQSMVPDGRVASRALSIQLASDRTGKALWLSLRNNRIFR